MSDISPTSVRRWSDTFITPPWHIPNVTAPLFPAMAKDDERSNDPIIWRCISYKPISAGMGGIMQQVMYDDMVSTERIGLYFNKLLERGIEKVTVKKMGKLSFCLESGMNPLRAGAERLSHEKKNHKLEEFL